MGAYRFKIVINRLECDLKKQMLISFYNIYKKNTVREMDMITFPDAGSGNIKKLKNSVLKKIGADGSVEQGIKLVWPKKLIEEDIILIISPGK